MEEIHCTKIFDRSRDKSRMAKSQPQLVSLMEDMHCTRIFDRRRDKSSLAESQRSCASADLGCGSSTSSSYLGMVLVLCTSTKVWTWLSMCAISPAPSMFCSGYQHI
mmetsp:Transcript_42092/g.127685  ORF Transcript_42092/g.127685 Transcript_42092/m.127685 type:complete len:107 (-) Transcript_42092:543-863(-)